MLHDVSAKEVCFQILRDEPPHFCVSKKCLGYAIGSGNKTKLRACLGFPDRAKARKFRFGQG
ncbi:MAG TPA: hypothetical protein PK858_08660, partial [Saprospiraceae bacterium]|nr:hypothetical protein [Saprospiraceae bacterium]